MEKTLHFIAAYNSQIIQVGFGVVFLLIIIYVYRLFFMSGQLESDTGISANTEAIEEKLNIIIDQQKNKVVTVASPQVSAEGNAGNEVEIDRLKAEIYNLHQKLKEATVNAEASGTAAPRAESSSAEAETNKTAAVSENSEEKIKLEEKVKNLESRLWEYEIIADDIAELSQLRADNAKLIEQISLLQSETKAEAKTEAKTEAKAEAKVEDDVQPPLEDLLEPFSGEVSAGEENLNVEESFNAEESVNTELPLSAEESLNVEESTSSVDSVLNEEEQNLMDDFAKTVSKKENE